MIDVEFHKLLNEMDKIILDLLNYGEEPNSYTENITAALIRLQILQQKLNYLIAQRLVK